MKNVCNYGNGYNSNNSIAIVWAIEDVEYRLDEFYPKLKYTNDNCMDILHSVADDHDAEFGVNWESIDYAIENYFYDELVELKENASVS